MKIKKFDSINVVPFIDIMLVLLVVVLTTASFIAKGNIPVELPKAQATTNNTKEKTEIVVTITKENKIYFDNNEVELTEVDAKLQNYKNDESLFKISCDKNAKFEYFVTLLDKFKVANLTNLAIVTQQ
ncbi:MAG: biopolymer transporter ExbD [Epsilonproteobacteria bacterium]|nr:biopolymer transporter ExbD [Campylobacterota bacterium]